MTEAIKNTKMVISDYIHSLPGFARAPFRKYLAAKLDITLGTLYIKISTDKWSIAERYYIKELIKEFEDARQNGILLIS